MHKCRWSLSSHPDSEFQPQRRHSHGVCFGSSRIGSQQRIRLVPEEHVPKDCDFTPCPAQASLTSQAQQQSWQTLRFPGIPNTKSYLYPWHEELSGFPSNKREHTLPRLLCFSRESSTKPLFPAGLYLSIDTAWIPTPTHSKMYFCLSSYVTFFLCIPLLRSGVTLSYTAHVIHNLHNEDEFQTESSRLSRRCKCKVYCTLHQLQITPQIYTPDYT